MERVTLYRWQLRRKVGAFRHEPKVGDSLEDKPEGSKRPAEWLFPSNRAESTPEPSAARRFFSGISEVRFRWRPARRRIIDSRERAVGADVAADGA